MSDGINYYSNGPMYNIDSSELSFDGLKNVSLIFSEKDQILLTVRIIFNKNKFDSLYKNRSQKYTLVKKDIPFVGNKDGNSIIILDAPHLSFDLDLEYISEEFNSRYLKVAESDKKQKNKSELDSL